MEQTGEVESISPWTHWLSSSSSSSNLSNGSIMWPSYKTMQSALKTTFQRESDLSQISLQSKCSLVCIERRTVKHPQQQQIKQLANPISAANIIGITTCFWSPGPAGLSAFQIEINWNQPYHIEEGKYLIWNGFTPRDLCFCSLMLARSIPSFLHRATGATGVKPCMLLMNHLSCVAESQASDGRQTLLSLFFSKGNISVVSHFASKSIKNSNGCLDAALKKNPWVRPEDSEWGDGLAVRKMCLLDKVHPVLWLHPGFSPKTTEAAQDLRALWIILVEILGFSLVHQSCLWKRCWKAIMTFSP